MALRTGSGSGTVRIGNSGELQNITSLDATTTATIGAAGGGATTLIHDVTLPTSGTLPTVIELDLTDRYPMYRCIMTGIEFDYDNGSSGKLTFMYKNSSNTVVTSAYNGAYFGVAAGSVTHRQISNMTIGDIGVVWVDNLYKGIVNLQIDICHANLNTQETMVNFKKGNEYADQHSDTIHGTLWNRNIDYTNYLQIYGTFSGASRGMFNGKYTMWGIDI